MRPSFKDEKALWEYIRPRLRGRWSRVEAVTPEGMFDSWGLFGRGQIWMELKVGKPTINALRPSQHSFLIELVRHDQPAWTCFGYRGEVLFFEGLDFDTAVVPPFYRPSIARS